MIRKKREREMCKGGKRGYCQSGGEGKAEMMGDIKWHKKIAWGLLTALSHLCFKMIFWLTFDLINEYKISLTFPQGISKHSLYI